MLIFYNKKHQFAKNMENKDLKENSDLRDCIQLKNLNMHFIKRDPSKDCIKHVGCTYQCPIYTKVGIPLKNGL